MLTLAISTLFFGLFESYKSYGASEVENEEYLVQSGDTVWGIANKRAKSQKKDVRDLVREIYILNDIDAKSLKSGEIILIPKF